MTAKRVSILALAMAVSGCIPPSAPPLSPSENPAPAPDDPLIAPRYEDVLDEPALWEARPVVANSVQSDEGEHRVVAGETLGGIALARGTSVAELARENGLEAPYPLRAGQMLRIPAGRWHRVEEGETGIAIARAYGLPWASLVALNGLEEPFILKVGQRLKLPAAALEASASRSFPAANAQTVDPVEARAAAFTLDIDDILTGGEPAIASVAGPHPAHTTAAQPVTEPARFSSGFGWPVAGTVVSRFGPAGEGQINQGIEIRTQPSTTIKASGDGVVAFVGDDVAVYGGMIMIRHGGGWISVYGRVANAAVRRGDAITRGDVIGTTGSGSAPQLHFQLRKARVPVDPLKQLPLR